MTSELKKYITFHLIVTMVQFILCVKEVNYEK